MTIAEYFVSTKSWVISRSNTPSVMNLIAVLALVDVSNRIWYATFVLWSPSSSPTRLAILTAARRGCVTPIIPGVGPSGAPYPDSRRNWGTCVVLPLPVAPQTTTTSLLCIASIIFCSSATMGSFNLDSCISDDRSTLTLKAFRIPSVAVFVSSSGGRGSCSGARGLKLAGIGA